MYVEKKKIGKNVYNYAKISFRVKNKVKTKTVAYLGKEPMSKEEINKKLLMISDNKVEYGKTLHPQFLNKEQIDKLNKIKLEYSKKQSNPDKSLIDDMFKDFKTYYIYNTNAIEGNTLSLSDTNLLLNENKTPANHDLREIYDHINEREAFDFILNKRPKITNKTIIKIQAMLLSNIDKRIGFFRKHDVRVFGADFKTTPAKNIKSEMDSLILWYKINENKMHPLILSALFHEKFERIHPFYDGNGRTGRMISNLILINNKYPPLIIKNSQRKKYYHVLSLGHKAESFNIEHHKPIVDLFYSAITQTWEKIFSKWV